MDRYAEFGGRRMRSMPRPACGRAHGRDAVGIGALGAAAGPGALWGRPTYLRRSDAALDRELARSVTEWARAEAGWDEPV